jgi:CubicO group peptidase (beta-lactamase class C family)
MKELLTKGFIVTVLLYSTSGFAQQSLDPAIVKLANELGKDEFVEEDRSVEPPSNGVNRRHPSVALPETKNIIGTLIAQYKGLKPVLASVNRALSIYQGGADQLELVYLSQTARDLQQAQDELARVKPYDNKIQSLQIRINDILLEMSKNALQSLYQADPHSPLYATATRVFGHGLRATEKLLFKEAAIHFNDIQDLSSNSIRFNIELFEQNIIGAMEDNAVGYALSIAYLGNQYNGGHAEGLARTAADSPSVNQSVYKEMHVASVSKSLTAIVVLKLLDQLGLNPDTKVWPYLPGNWVIGPGSEQLSFRDFMTHSSGADQQAMGSSYSALQTFIENGPGANQSFSYNNGNFGMMRVLVAGLLGIDPVDYPEFAADVLTASAFIIQAKSLYDDIGVTVDCSSSDNNPTIQYNFPDGGASGYEEPDRSLGCGGVGWFISANEMTNVATHLRNTQLLLSDTARDWMQDGSLGLMDPSRYSQPNGNFGTYYTHGGDWGHGPGELHTCFMMFPIKVEASLFLNSERAPGLPYQCDILKNAFDAAWTM